ncbi:hypothetical protein Ae201684_013179 [Aphanomyces euteiches]|uniref:Uncharacterized protein n=1 Tax=Aphanomyces euteiches TaxID=100861 RepID=A0A6G0WPE5_9STRA|nr:hypothetical protein Ae201684_013179 [Aphanomyces euteiches]
MMTKRIGGCVVTSHISKLIKFPRCCLTHGVPVVQPGVARARETATQKHIKQNRVRLVTCRVLLVFCARVEQRVAFSESLLQKNKLSVHQHFQLS